MAFLLFATCGFLFLIVGNIWIPLDILLGDRFIKLEHYICFKTSIDTENVTENKSALK